MEDSFPPPMFEVPPESREGTAGWWGRCPGGVQMPQHGQEGAGWERLSLEQ